MSDGRVLHVLLAEHDRVDQQVAQLFLTRLGHRVDVVRDGTGLVDAVGRGRCDAVLVTPSLPGGLDAVRGFRAEPAPSGQPFVVATAVCERADHLTELYAAGVDTVVAKPIRADSLAAVLAPLARTTSSTRVHDVHARIADLVGHAPTPAETAVLVEVIDLFLAGVAATVDRLAAETAAGDTAAAAATAHRLKGSAGNVGARALADLASFLEHRLRTSAVLGPCSLVGRIQDEAAQARVTLSVARAQLLTRHG